MVNEYAGAQLGDDRRSKRLVEMAKWCWRSPVKSIPKMFGEAGSEAFYRFSNNDDISPEAVLQPHFDQSYRRASSERVIVVAHDTSTIQLEGEREGLGYLPGDKQGFFLHCALGISLQGKRKPLGLLGMKTIFRRQPSKGKRTLVAARADTARESLRWHQLRADVGDRAKREGFEVIHVMDREADDYELFSEIISAGERFVIRLYQDRRLSVQSGGGKLFAAVDSKKAIFYRDVPLSPRKTIHGRSNQDRKSHPLRDSRRAKLAFSSTRVEIQRVVGLPATLPKSLCLNVVNIVEVDPPEGEEPVRWRLYTTEPIKSQTDIEKIADIYMSRWLIEEFFKALKTGCAFQKRQFVNAHSILTALAFFLPMAYGLLLLRYFAHEGGAMKASEVLSEAQIAVLRVVSKHPPPPEMTARDAMLAVAALGGHLKQNGNPGWIVLGRGYEELLTLERGWSAALRLQKM